MSYPTGYRRKTTTGHRPEQQCFEQVKSYRIFSRHPKSKNDIIFDSKTPSHHAIDLDEKPLLYDYYANTLNPIIDKRNFDEIDRFAFGKRFFLERPRPVAAALTSAAPASDQKFHEVERSDYQDFMKRMLNDDRVVKRYSSNFDEIDRFGLNQFVQSAPYHVSLLNKRNFDEIDRFGPEMFADTKRMPSYHDNDINEIDRTNKFLKFV